MNDQRRLTEIMGTAESIAADWSRACRDAPLSVEAALPIAELLIEAMAADEIDLDWRLVLSSGGVAVPTVEQLRQLRTLLFHRSAEHAPGIRRHIDLFLDDLTDKVVEHHLHLVEQEALTDALTGVGNRRAFERDVERELLGRARRDEQLTVTLIDLDRLKRLNDEIGHEAGDDALRALAASFRAAQRVTDAIYRIGGDEFVVLLPDTGAAGAEAVVARAAELAPPFSYGIAVAPSDGTSGRELMEAADRILRSRKRRGYDADGSPPPVVAGTDRRLVASSGETEQRDTADAPTVMLRRLTVHWAGQQFSVEVVLAAAGREVQGSATSSAVGDARHRAVAEATLQCLTALGLAPDGVYLSRTELCDCVGVKVATASLLSMQGSHEQISFGVGTLEQGTMEGIVFAVIDAAIGGGSRGMFARSL